LQIRGREFDPPQLHFKNLGVSHLTNILLRIKTRRFVMGDLTRNQLSRKRSLENYYSDPKLCKTCGEVIRVGEHQKVSDIKRRQFCSLACSASSTNNISGQGRKRTIGPHGECERCGIVINYTVRTDRLGYRKVRFCLGCRIKAGHETLLKTHKKNGVLTWDLVGELTKEELLEKSGGSPYWFKVKVTNHAQVIWRQMGKPPGCEICDFQFHAICHKKPVKDFANNVKIKEINDPKNLIGLCPNHHWLLDRGLLDLKEV
jgi:hypothetical protein